MDRAKPFGVLINGWCNLHNAGCIIQVAGHVLWPMRFRTELISDSTVYTISDWFHATFKAFSFENTKTV